VEWQPYAEEVNKMLAWRLSDEEVMEDEKDEEKDPAFRANHRCKIFLGRVGTAFHNLTLRKKTPMLTASMDQLLTAKYVD
jgi:hypothetical protein